MRYCSRLVIDLSLLKNNYQKLREIAPGAKIVFMVKADAYGHGLIPIVRYSLENLAIEEFGCASLKEAIFLRESLPEQDFIIYVFSDLNLNIKKYREQYVAKRIIPVIYDLKSLKLLLHNSQIPLCLKFNTGMNRLGISIKEQPQVISLLQQFKRTTIFHLLSHFACASDPIEKNSMTLKQNELFQKIKKNFIENNIVLERTSIANSGAIEQKIGLEETHIRPGLMLYGPSSMNIEHNWQGENLSCLETVVLAVEKIKKDDPIGYGATLSPNDGLLVHIAIGYGDGISGNYQNATIYWQNTPGKIIGKVNMDMTAVLFPVDLTIKPGDKIVIWDKNAKRVIDLANSIKSSPYEIFCQLSKRISREYK